MKKVLKENEKEGVKEIGFLTQFSHKNVVKLIEVCEDRGDTKKFYLVLEFCQHELGELLHKTFVCFTLGEIKNVMQQLLTGLHYIHAKKIMHRDMKPENILITVDGVLKLADFGMSRTFSDSKEKNRYTNRVVTLWYRPPELLLGERNYTPAIDMWGAGCTFAQMWTRYCFLKGKTQQHQLKLICQLCGSITPEVWPDVEKLELYQSLELPHNLVRQVKEKLRFYVKDERGETVEGALDLIDQLLALDPSRRLDSGAALSHPFFSAQPEPEDLRSLLSSLSSP